MSKSKHSPALFEVIGNKAQYKSGGESAPDTANAGRASQPQPAPGSRSGGGIAPGGHVGSKAQPPPVQTVQKPETPKPAATTAQAVPRPRPIVSPQPTPDRSRISGGRLDSTSPPAKLFDLRRGRVHFSLTAANGMIAAGCVFLTLFAVFVFGYRTGAGAGVGDGAEIQQHLDEIASARRKTANPSVLQLEMSRSGNGESAGNDGSGAKSGSATADVAGSGKTPANRRTSSNSPISIEPAGRQPVTGASANDEAVSSSAVEDPRVPGQTYIVVEFFPKSPDHDALAESRHAAAFLAENGVDTFIVEGDKGYQLVTRKGFTYSTERQALLAYKQRIRKLAKDYKPFDRTYLFISFEKTHRPPND